MSKTDNIFAKVISNPAICKEYGITNPEKYDNIAAGLKSSNNYIVAIATVLREINFTYEMQLANMRAKHKEGAAVLQDSDMKELYRKVVSLLEKAR